MSNRRMLMETQLQIKGYKISFEDQKGKVCKNSFQLNECRHKPKGKQEQGFPGGSVIKNPPAKAGDMNSIPGLGRSPGEETLVSCWEIPWTEEPGGYSPWGHKRVGHNLMTKQQSQKSKGSSEYRL